MSKNMIIHNQPSMFYNAKSDIFAKAELLRKNLTRAELLLWNSLRNNQMGVRFKAQHPIDIFIADFYCHKLKLVIEIDGGIHLAQKEHDDGRTSEMEYLGIKVIHFTNEEVENQTKDVLNRIRAEINKGMAPKSPKGDF
jgi:very-short-patch-repair endonuclease